MSTEFIRTEIEAITRGGGLTTTQQQLLSLIAQLTQEVSNLQHDIQKLKEQQ